MKKYIVGGACRDRLLGVIPKDKDYVLVGATKKDIEYLTSIGYTQVGADFPVFLSPDGNEYALARTERKNGSGYAGFDVNTSGVTLEEDLYRRDLTVNAIAYDPVLKVHIDPYNGIGDIENKVLKHVSEHFKEDPLRVLRLARFKSRYSDFTVHKDTDEMVKNMVSNNELNHLTKERVYVEFEKAFAENKTEIFLDYLNSVGALNVLFNDNKYNSSTSELVKMFSEQSTPAYKDEYLWCTLLLGKKVSKDNVHCMFKLPTRFVKFKSFIETNSDFIINFRKKSVSEITEFFTKINVRNNGGEEFIYKVLEYFSIKKDIDHELFELIIKVYDRFEDTEIGNIEDMVKTGELKNSEIRNYVFNLRLTEIEKMFK